MECLFMTGLNTAVYWRKNANKLVCVNEDSENGIYAKSDEKKDSVVDVMSDERAGLIGIDEEAEEPE